MTLPFEHDPNITTSFPKGPWQDEPNIAEWTDTLTGYECAMIRHQTLGHWCGYVHLPITHKLHSYDYDSKIPFDENDLDGTMEEIGIINLFWAALDPDKPNGTVAMSICFRCHGGLTYAKNGWFGFDCGHSGDLSPGMIYNLSGIYRDAAYVRAVVTDLAKQFHHYQQKYCQ